MYLVASRDYSIKDRCNSLLLIVEVWTGIGPVVFSFALRGFLRKNSRVLFIFLLHEFIYLLLLIVIAYLILYKKNGRKIVVFVRILWIYPNNMNNMMWNYCDENLRNNALDFIYLFIFEKIFGDISALVN